MTNASVLWMRLERCQLETERRAVRLRRAAAASGLTASTITSVLAALQSGVATEDRAGPLVAAAFDTQLIGGGTMNTGISSWEGGDA